MVEQQRTAEPGAPERLSPGRRLCGHRPGVLPVPRHELHAEVQGPADRSRLEERLGADQRRIEDEVLEALEMAARLLRGGEHAIGLRHRHRHRLLHAHVRARPHRRRRHLGVERVGRQDVDEVRLEAQELVEASHELRLREERGPPVQ
jgi:hypothetical protein